MPTQRFVSTVQDPMVLIKSHLSMDNRHALAALLMAWLERQNPDGSYTGGILRQQMGGGGDWTFKYKHPMLIQPSSIVHVFSLPNLVSGGTLLKYCYGPSRVAVAAVKRSLLTQHTENTNDHDDRAVRGVQA